MRSIKEKHRVISGAHKKNWRDLSSRGVVGGDGGTRRRYVERESYMIPVELMGRKLCSVNLYDYLRYKRD